MAIITQQTEVCDVCRDPGREVRVYRVAEQERSVRVALCAVEHAGALEEILALGTSAPSTSPRVRVWDMEEIERKKAQQGGRRPR